MCACVDTSTTSTMLHHCARLSLVANNAPAQFQSRFSGGVMCGRKALASFFLLSVSAFLLTAHSSFLLVSKHSRHFNEMQLLVTCHSETGIVAAFCDDQHKAKFIYARNVPLCPLQTKFLTQRGAALCNEPNSFLL